jgi:urease accessory protein
MALASTSRGDPAWYTPTGLPAELLALGGPVRGGLAVGAPGKVGLLELALARSNGATRLAHHYQRAPLYIYRPIHLDPARPDMAFIYMLQSGDGFVQGDRYRIDVSCGPGAAAHVTTQAASKVFGARQNFATQVVNLTVGAGAVLEYLPDPVVPFARSRLFQRTRLTAHPDSTVILSETLLPGRVAHGESHAFDLYWSETEACTPDGSALFADLLRLNPGSGEDPHSIALLGAHNVIATLYILTARAEPSTLVGLLRSATGTTAGVLAGASELPNGCGASLRVLGTTAKGVQDELRSAWSAVRVALLGAPAPNLRKG